MDAYRTRFCEQHFTGVEGDLGFYVEEARAVDGPVLELGCGSGRVLFAMAAAGIPAVGLETDEELLARARQRLSSADAETQRNVKLVAGDMRAFALGRSFGLIAIPYRTFQHLLTPVDQTQSLECIRSHLRQGGRLVFNIFDPLQDMARFGLDQALRRETDFIDPGTGHQIVVWYSRHYDPQVQLMEQELIYDEVDEQGQAVGRTYGRLTLRYSSRWEVQYLLERGGFVVEALYGDFGRRPFPGYGEQIWIARKE